MIKSLNKFNTGVKNNTLLFRPSHPLFYSTKIFRRRTSWLAYAGWVHAQNFGDDIIAEIFKLMFLSRNVVSAYPRLPIEIRIALYFGHRIENHVILGGGTLIGGNMIKCIEQLPGPDKKILTFGTGVVNRTLSKADKEKWSKILQMGSFVSVRGPRSAEILYRDFKLREIDVFGDPALQASRVVKPGTRSAETVGFNVGSHRFGRRPMVLDAVISILKKLSSKGYRIVGFALSPPDTKIVQECLIRAELPPENLVNLFSDRDGLRTLSSCSFMLSERLHGTILSHAYGVPSIAIYYDDKIYDHFDSVGVRPFIANDELNLENVIWEFFCEMEKEREDLSVEIKSRLKLIIRKQNELVSHWQRNIA